MCTLGRCICWLVVVSMMLVTFFKITYGSVLCSVHLRCFEFFQQEREYGGRPKTCRSVGASKMSLPQWWTNECVS